MLLANSNTWKYWQGDGGFLRPPSPQLWGSMNSKSPRIDAAGEFNNWTYRQFWKSFEAPQPPILGGHILKVPQLWGI